MTKLVGALGRPLLYQLATAKVKECPFGHQLLEDTRAEITEVLKRSTSEEAGLWDKVKLEPIFEDQKDPIQFQLMGVMLWMANDPDWSFPYHDAFSAAKGVKLGHDTPLPRTPAVFEKKLKWRKYDPEILEGPPEWGRNYISASENVPAVRKQFVAEAALGMMVCLDLEDAKREWAENLHVASLAALAKADDSCRILHDGTHGVKVNPRIRVRDQIRMPSVAEQKVILQEVADTQLSRFALKGDVSKAHRRVRVRRQDWGAQACALDVDQEVWVNTVGTFGLASAGYYWGRLVAAAGRLPFYFLRDSVFWQLVFADDFSWTAAGPQFDEDLLFTVFLMSCLGIPFSWEKFGGGLQYEWIGFALDLIRFEAGLAEKRRLWLVKWLQEVLEKRVVLVRHFADVLGRIQYAALALQFLRPFLGPLYAWSCAVPGGACIPLPGAIRLILTFMLKLLNAGPAMVPCRALKEVRRLEFRADAKAEGDDVGVGGWCVDPRGPGHSRWFSLKLDRKSAPWAYRSGEPFRTIASLELFATLLCVMLFASSDDDGDRPTIVVTGTTDNRGNSFAVAKLMTVKFPLCAILMEIAAVLHQRNSDLDLTWAPREQNIEADELSNGDCKRFRPELRIEVRLADLQFIVLPELLDKGEVFYRLVAKLKTAPKVVLTPAAAKRKRKPETRLRATHPW